MFLFLLPAAGRRVVHHFILRANRLSMVGGRPEHVVLIGVLGECGEGAQDEMSPLNKFDIRLFILDVTGDGEHKRAPLLFRSDRLQVPAGSHTARAETADDSNMKSGRAARRAITCEEVVDVVLDLSRQSWQGVTFISFSI